MQSLNRENDEASLLGQQVEALHRRITNTDPVEAVEFENGITGLLIDWKRWLAGRPSTSQENFQND